MEVICHKDVLLQVNKMRRAAMEQAAKKDDGFRLNLSSLYLILYNLALALGWTVITVKLLVHLFVHETYVGLYAEVKTLLNVFQTLALLEVVHAATGLVRSNPVITGFQVISRIFMVWGIVYMVPEAQDQLGFPLLCFAWCITEVIRYSFYLGSLVQYTPFPLQFLRYTLFIVLYPMGVTGELLSVYSSLPHIRERGILSIPLPNVANLSFDYYSVLLFVMLLYVPFFPQLYLHMFSQRKKVLGSSKQNKDD